MQTSVPLRNVIKCPFYKNFYKNLWTLCIRMNEVPYRGHIFTGKGMSPDPAGWESFSKKDLLATWILVMMEFLILLYRETWSWELEHLAFLNIRSLLAMSLLMSLVIQGVADLIGTCLVGMEQFMASRKTVSHFLQKKSMLSSLDAIGSFSSTEVLTSAILYTSCTRQAWEKYRWYALWTAYTVHS